MYYLFCGEQYEEPSGLGELYKGTFATLEDAFQFAAKCGWWAELWTITDGNLTHFATYRQSVEPVGELRRIVRDGWDTTDGTFHEMHRYYQQRAENPTTPTIALSFGGVDMSKSERIKATGVWMPAYHWITVEPWE